MSLEEKESDDVRIDYISGITTAVLAIDSGLWAELVWKEDNVLIMKDFLDTPATRLLLIYVDKKDKLSVTVEFPKQRPLSDKCMYFLKYQDIAIPLTDFRKHFMHGSLSHLPLKLHHAIFEQVMMPILCNPQNNVKWPADVYEDIKLHFQDFRKTIYYCVGQANGKTVLPIPETAKQVDLLDTDNIDRESMGDANTRDILDSIGGMVVDWTTLVNEVISTETSGNPLHDVDGHGPLSEIVFWKARKENLEFIFQQINEPLVKKMATLIEKVQSCYSEAFMKLLRNVVENLAEAEDVANCLQILTEPFKKFANCPFSEMKDLIPELIRTVTCSWKSSKYFSSIPSRIGVLVKRICNQVIVKIRDYLDGPNLFHKDRALAEEEIKDAKEILDSFIKSYCDCRDGMESTFEHAKLYPWEFPDERVFSGLHKFIQRLNDIRDLFDAADTYNWIPQFDLRGLHQMELKLRLNGIFEEFSKEYLIFEDSKCDILDLNEEKFQENYLQYQSKIQDLDCRLGTAISQGCVQSTSTSEAYKLMQTFNTLIKRPLVEIGFRNCVPNLIIKVRGELKLARKMYENNIKCLAEKGYCIVYRNTPTIAGNIIWATEVKEKLSASMEALKAMKKYFITENDAEAEEQMYNELMNLLTNYQKNTFLDWSRSTDSDVSSMVNQSVLTEGDNGRIVVNYDMRMSAVIEEVRRLVKTELENIPESAIGLNDQRDNLRYVRSVLTSAVSWYNTLCEELVPFEKILISEHWDEIKELLEQGKKMTWKDSGLKDLAAKVFNLTKGVYENIRKTKENINEVRKLIEGWTQHPIYARESPTALINLKIYMTPEVRQQYNDVKLASMKMQEKMEENLRLFECNAESQEWLDYLKYLEEVIEEGLKECAIYNLQYLFDNTDSSNTKLTPFTKVQLVLDFDEGLTFLPPMMGKRAGSLLNCFESATDKICEMSEQATRMTNDQETYSNSLSGCDKLNSLKSGIIKHVLHSTANVMEAIADFERYEDLWLISIDDALEDFLLYGPAEAYEEEDEEEEELHEGANVNLTSLVENPPTEEEFREQISTFELLLRKAEEIEPTIIIDNWLLVDLTPFKEDLLLVIRQWIIAYREKFMEQKSLGKLRKVVKEELD